MEHYNLKRMIMKKSIILLAMVLGAFTEIGRAHV